MFTVALAMILGLTRKHMFYVVVSFALAIHAIQFWTARCLERAGLRVRWATAPPLVGWFTTPSQYLKLAPEYGWPRWPIAALWLCVLGFLICSYLVVHWR